MSHSTSPDDFRFSVIESGFTGNSELAHSALTHVDDMVRVSALHALRRLSKLTAAELSLALTDTSANVRRTAVELASKFLDIHIASFIHDADVFVSEMTAWSIGEREVVTEEELAALISAATSHPEMLVREAAAAALGSIGDVRGLPAILIACSDKPAVRRRAVLALAPFDGVEVEQALQQALQDNDWQVRQNAEILLHPR